MGKVWIGKRRGRLSPALFACAALALGVPGASLAVASKNAVTKPEASSLDFLPFTPAGADPHLAQKVAALVGEDALRFTPASKPRPIRDRTVTFAVRVDDKLARSIGSRPAIEPVLGTSASGDVAPTLASTRYNLGIARGYQSFTKPAMEMGKAAPKVALRDFSMPDLKTLKSERKDEPSRFHSRVALEQEGRLGRAPGTLEGAGEQRIDVSGSYRLSRNLDVTAGVRLSQERDRLAPLTNGVEDDQAVYVGTQLKF